MSPQDRAECPAVLFSIAAVVLLMLIIEFYPG